jgi:hypothetical protein
MFAMFRQFFSMFAALFSAGSRLANAADHAAAFVEGEAAGFNERTSLARVQELKKMRSQYTQEDYRLAAEEAQARRNFDKSVDNALRTPAQVEQQPTAS